MKMIIEGALDGVSKCQLEPTNEGTLFYLFALKPKIKRRVERNKHTHRKFSTNIAIKVITLSEEYEIVIVDEFADLRNFKDPFVNDGLLEVICFRDAWHGDDFLPSKDRGECLAQVS
ncbi:hypothetical protein CK203_098584 [Vitis vinifera]|uniref:Uncharacterized protein n=1 Tax=Vitis vinifera TaxID=29760 RepID=A0A438E500_VITVI|nr:hypothetical protein CK203_098584 [Vitis vinifera]